MRGTALLLVLSWSAPVALAQATVESLISPHTVAPVRTPQLLVPAMDASTNPVPAKAKAPKEAATSKPVDPQFNDLVTDLAAASGLRQELMKSRQAAVQKDKEAILQNSPDVSRSAAEDAAKRLEKKLSPDDFLNVVVQVYAQNFTKNDVLEMLHVKQNSFLPVSPQLRAKLAAASGKVHDQIVSGFEQLERTRMAEIQQEMGKENPELLAHEEAAFSSGKTAKPWTGGSEMAIVTAADAENSSDFVVTPAN